MRAQEHLENIIKELNFKSNLCIPKVEEDGSYYYTYADKFEVTLKASDQENQIAFYAFLLKGLKNRRGLFKKLLWHNFLLSDTYGSAFALAQGSGDISLRRFFPAQDLDALEFENQINTFLFAADEWHSKLHDWLQQDEDENNRDEKRATGSSMAHFLKA